MRMFRLGAWGVALPPSSSALVVSIAPESRRGIYLALNSLCWAIGYLLGPPLGGFALDLPRPWADAFWVVLSGTVLIVLFGLQKLQQLCDHLATSLKQS
jgi:MFS family permease